LASLMYSPTFSNNHHWSQDYGKDASLRLPLERSMLLTTIRRVCTSCDSNPIISRLTTRSKATDDALSRVRCLEHLLIYHENFDLDRLLSIKLNPDIKEFDKRTVYLANETVKRFNDLIPLD
jgi:hypothetical protein